MLLITSLIFLYLKYNTDSLVTQTIFTPSPSLLPKEDVIETAATFRIITNNTIRTFTDSRYHNLSKDVYITSEDPNRVVVKKKGTTWSDFFKTLPMSLDENCLVTGTKQTFCTNETKKLYFYINNTESATALDSLIRQDDFLLIEYK